MMTACDATSEWRCMLGFPFQSLVPACDRLPVPHYQYLFVLTPLFFRRKKNESFLKEQISDLWALSDFFLTAHKVPELLPLNRSSVPGRRFKQSSFPTFSMRPHPQRSSNTPRNIRHNGLSVVTIVTIALLSAIPVLCVHLLRMTLLRKHRAESYHSV